MSRVSLLFALAGLLVVAAADAATGLRFTSALPRLKPGQQVSVAIAVRPVRGPCTLTVKYADGRRQPGLRATSGARGRARWTWTVPADATPGRGSVMAWCAYRGKITRPLTVAGRPVARPALVVEKRGFSQRDISTLSLVSYGVVLGNTDVVNDVVDVYVLVNFLDADGVVVQSTTHRIPGIAAASSYNLGGSTTVGLGATVDRLEVELRIDDRAPGVVHMPTLNDVRIVPSRFDAGWVGSVDGEVLNDHPSLVLSNARVSAVIFDAGGNVVGGAYGFVSATLSPGARAFFTATTGAMPISTEDAASVDVSVDARYLSRAT